MVVVVVACIYVSVMCHIRHMQYYIYLLLYYNILCVLCASCLRPSMSFGALSRSLSLSGMQMQLGNSAGIAIVGLLACKM
jgi:hypothetical protein